jgi:hypothetical protein
MRLSRSFNNRTAKDISPRELSENPERLESTANWIGLEGNLYKGESGVPKANLTGYRAGFACIASIENPRRARAKVGCGCRSGTRIGIMSALCANVLQKVAGAAAPKTGSIGNPKSRIYESKFSLNSRFGKLFFAPRLKIVATHSARRRTLPHAITRALVAPSQPCFIVGSEHRI